MSHRVSLSLHSIVRKSYYHRYFYPRYYIPQNFCYTFPMKSLIATLCLTIAVILGSMGNSESADFQKGLTAYRSNDYATALREWEPLAEQGDAFAQYNLGVMYANGDGVPQDDKIALKWFTLAAEQGHAGAKTNLSILQKEMAKTKNSPTVTAKKPSTKRNEVPSIKHRISVLESMKACQVSLSNPKCNLDILVVLNNNII